MLIVLPRVFVVWLERAGGPTFRPAVVAGSTLLADRLKSRESAGVLARVVLPPPAWVAAYELTPAGAALGSVLGELAAWGLRHGSPYDERDATRSHWVVLALFAGHGSKRLRGRGPARDRRRGGRAGLRAAARPVAAA
jgi:hypothetical protein